MQEPRVHKALGDAEDSLRELTARAQRLQDIPPSLLECLGQLQVTLAELRHAQTDLIAEIDEQIDRRVRERTAAIEPAARIREELLQAEHDARRKAEAAEAELRKSNDAKDEFLGMVSHEIRTPLSVLYGGVKVLRSRLEYLNEREKAELLSDMEVEAERLRRLTEDLMMVARVELDQAIAVEPVLIQRLVERVAPRHGNVRLHLHQGLPPVAADPTFLEQIIRNLVDNARKYGAPDAPIDVRVDRNGESEVVIRVLDRGAALPPEDLQRIFERFYRGRNNPSKPRGAGLGLTVCKRLIEAQSGRIWAKGREGGGLEVAVALPVYREHAG